MPDNTRGLLIKKCESALLHLASLEEIFMYMHGKYDVKYPEYAELIAMSELGVSEIISAMRHLREVM